MSRSARRSIALPASAPLVAAGVLSVAASAQPYAIAVLGIMVLGAAHVLLAARYLAGRVVGAVGESTGWLLAAFVGAMMVVRVASAWSPALGQRLELIGSMTIIAIAAWLGLRGRARWLVLAIVVIVACSSFVHVPWYWHVFSHSHNLIPLVFLWDWARRHRAGTGLAFTALNLIWACGIPALILAGVFDGVINSAAPEFVSGLIDPAFVLGSAAPPHADPQLAVRFLVSFTYLQLMHYVVWMVFFQVAGRSEIGALERRFPAIAGWRFWLIVAAISVAIWGVYAFSYIDGRAIYAILGAANVYLEQPIAVWVLLAALPARATTGLVHGIAATG